MYPCLHNYRSNKLTQSKSKTQSQEVCTVNSIVLLLTLIGHNMAFKSIRISAASMVSQVARSLAGQVLSEVWPATWAVHGVILAVWCCCMGLLVLHVYTILKWIWTHRLPERNDLLNEKVSAPTNQATTAGFRIVKCYGSLKTSLNFSSYMITTDSPTSNLLVFYSVKIFHTHGFTKRLILLK